MDNDNKYAIAYGRPVDGFYFVGPFDSQADASLYAESEDTTDWWVIELQNPADLFDGGGEP